MRTRAAAVLAVVVVVVLALDLVAVLLQALAALLGAARAVPAALAWGLERLADRLARNL